MQSGQRSVNKRRQLNSQDLKKRLYEKGSHGSSMPSLKLQIKKTCQIFFIKNENINSPKVLKKTASAFTQTFYNYNNNKKGFNKTGINNFQIKKLPTKLKSEKSDDHRCSPASKTMMNFYKEKEEQINQLNNNNVNNSNANVEPHNDEIVFNSSFYKNDSVLRITQSKMTKRLMQKMAGNKSKQKSKSSNNKSKDKNKNQQKQLLISHNNNNPHDSFTHETKSKDQIIQKDIKQKQQIIAGSQLKTNTINPNSNQPLSKQSSLQQYINLILNNVPNIDEFLYLIRQSKPHQHISQDQDNIYQLQIIDYQKIRQRQKQVNFEYYTISKKGFCHYFNGKPIEFIDLNQWMQQKIIYEKIKKLNFFNRFRRWKTIKMWVKKVVRHRIQKCSQSLDQKLFILNPTIRTCILQIKFINLQMEKNLSIISKNQGTYSLQSFKHCQQKTRRQAAGIVEEFSRKSRQSVKRCFQVNLQNLKQILKTKQSQQEKNYTNTGHNPKDNAFQALGFPAKMSYEHRSKLRKLSGRFVRLSYLVDIIHLNGLASIFKTQIKSFSQKLSFLQISNQIRTLYTNQQLKSPEQVDRQKMFNINLLFKPSDILQQYIEFTQIQVFDFSTKIQKSHEMFNPLYHIKQKSLTSNKSIKSNHDEENKKYIQRRYVNKICELWLTLKPNFQTIFDQLSFLIKQSMNSLKYFQRWSKHREMQKYVNILEEWDDIVSQNWEISENDNLDPISIIDNLQSSLNKIKQVIQVSENKLGDKIVNQLTQPLVIYWQNTQTNIQKLLTDSNIENIAQTIQFYLAYMTQNIHIFQTTIPQILQLGIFTINISKIKLQLIQFMKNILQQFKSQLPNYIEDKTNHLNIWLNEKSLKLKQQIHNIDDFVKISKSLKQLQNQFYHKKQLSNDLAHLYQTMHNNRIETKKENSSSLQHQNLKINFNSYSLMLNKIFNEKLSSLQRKSPSIICQIY